MSLRRPAFSLIEMMIAIVILGLGLVMVATMFPVAWTRARTLSETTVQRSIAAGAQARSAQSLKPSTLMQPLAGPPQLSAGSLIGDFYYTHVYDDGVDAWREYILSPSDTRVHALNMSNLKAEDLEGEFVDEDPWELEPNITEFFQPNPSIQEWFEGLGDNSPFRSQLPFTERVFPPLPPRPPTSNAAERQRWYEQLDQRRFVLATFHRLQSPVGPGGPPRELFPPPADQEPRQQAQSAMARTRVFDVYHLTLRKPNPTNRYARQDPASTPDTNPTLIDSPAPVPAALPAAEDVIFPVPWRVEVDFYVAPTANKTVTATNPGPTGVPTEVRVPRPGVNSLIPSQLFQQGTRFIDELSGRIYRVTNRRIAFENDRQVAYLTLDREVFIEDLDYMDPAQFVPDGAVQPEEQIRTVWIFPPAVDRTDSQNPNFDGPSPVVSIDVRTMTLSPSS